MSDIRMIAAIGKRGQLGLDGRLPWSNEVGDLPWFKEQTVGHIVIIGSKTISPISLLGHAIWAWRRDEEPQTVIDACAKTSGQRIIWIAGGARTYAAFAPYCTKFIITRVDYDGPADSWFDPAWLAASQHSDEAALRERIAFLESRRDELQAANNRLLNRARDAEVWPPVMPPQGRPLWIGMDFAVRRGLFTDVEAAHG